MSQEDIKEKVQGLIKNSRNEGKHNEDLVYRSVKNWKQNPSYLFDLIEDLIIRKDERYLQLLVLHQINFGT